MKSEIRNRFNGGLMFRWALAALSRRRSGSGFGFRISSRRAVAPSQRVGLRISGFGFSIAHV